MFSGKTAQSGAQDQTIPHTHMLRYGAAQVLPLRTITKENIVELRTPRLVLRCLQSADQSDLFCLLNNWNVIRYMATPPYPYTQEAAADYIHAAQKNHQEKQVGIFAITRAQDDALMGGCQIMPDGKGAARLAYWLGEPYWGHAYVPEAVGAVMAHAFNDWKVQVVTAYVHLKNDASCRVLTKMGFQDAGLVPAPALTGRRRGTDQMHKFILNRLDWRGTHQR